MEEEELFEVEAILETRKRDGKRYYKVRWKGYEPADDTWEPEDNVIECEDALKEFCSNRKKEREDKQKQKRKQQVAEEAGQPGQVRKKKKQENSSTSTKNYGDRFDQSVDELTLNFLENVPVEPLGMTRQASKELALCSLRKGDFTVGRDIRKESESEGKSSGREQKRYRVSSGSDVTESSCEVIQKSKSDAFSSKFLDDDVIEISSQGSDNDLDETIELSSQDSEIHTPEKKKTANSPRNKVAVISLLSDTEDEETTESVNEHFTSVKTYTGQSKNTERMASHISSGQEHSREMFNSKLPPGKEVKMSNSSSPKVVDKQSSVPKTSTSLTTEKSFSSLSTRNCSALLSTEKPSTFLTTGRSSSSSTSKSSTSLGTGESSVSFSTGTFSTSLYTGKHFKPISTEKSSIALSTDSTIPTIQRGLVNENKKAMAKSTANDGSAGTKSGVQKSLPQKISRSVIQGSDTQMIPVSLVKQYESRTLAWISENQISGTQKSGLQSSKSNHFDTQEGRTKASQASTGGSNGSHFQGSSVKLTKGQDTAAQVSGCRRIQQVERPTSDLKLSESANSRSGSTLGSGTQKDVTQDPGDGILKTARPETKLPADSTPKETSVAATSGPKKSGSSLKAEGQGLGLSSTVENKESTRFDTQIPDLFLKEPQQGSNEERTTNRDGKIQNIDHKNQKPAQKSDGQKSMKDVERQRIEKQKAEKKGPTEQDNGSQTSDDKKVAQKREATISSSGITTIVTQKQGVFVASQAPGFRSEDKVKFSVGNIKNIESQSSARKSEKTKRSNVLVLPESPRVDKGKSLEVEVEKSEKSDVEDGKPQNMKVVDLKESNGSSKYLDDQVGVNVRVSVVEVLAKKLPHEQKRRREEIEELNKSKQDKSGSNIAYSKSKEGAEPERDAKSDRKFSKTSKDDSQLAIKASDIIRNKNLKKLITGKDTSVTTKKGKSEFKPKHDVKTTKKGVNKAITAARQERRKSEGFKTDMQRLKEGITELRKVEDERGDKETSTFVSLKEKLPVFPEVKKMEISEALSPELQELKAIMSQLPKCHEPIPKGKIHEVIEVVEEVKEPETILATPEVKISKNQNLETGEPKTPTSVERENEAKKLQPKSLDNEHVKINKATEETRETEETETQKFTKDPKSLEEDCVAKDPERLNEVSDKVEREVQSSKGNNHEDKVVEVQLQQSDLPEIQSNAIESEAQRSKEKLCEEEMVEVQEPKQYDLPEVQGNAKETEALSSNEKLCGEEMVEVQGPKQSDLPEVQGNAKETEALSSNEKLCGEEMVEVQEPKQSDLPEIQGNAKETEALSSNEKLCEDEMVEVQEPKLSDLPEIQGNAKETEALSSNEKLCKEKVVEVQPQRSDIPEVQYDVNHLKGKRAEVSNTEAQPKARVLEVKLLRSETSAEKESVLDIERNSSILEEENFFGKNQKEPSGEEKARETSSASEEVIAAVELATCIEVSNQGMNVNSKVCESYGSETEFTSTKKSPTESSLQRAEGVLSSVEFPTQPSDLSKDNGHPEPKSSLEKKSQSSRLVTGSESCLEKQTDLESSDLSKDAGHPEPKSSLENKSQSSRLATGSESCLEKATDLELDNDTIARTESKIEPKETSIAEYVSEKNENKDTKKVVLSPRKSSQLFRNVRALVAKGLDLGLKTTKAFISISLEESYSLAGSEICEKAGSADDTKDNGSGKIQRYLGTNMARSPDHENRSEGPITVEDRSSTNSNSEERGTSEAGMSSLSSPVSRKPEKSDSKCRKEKQFQAEEVVQIDENSLQESVKDNNSVETNATSNENYNEVDYTAGYVQLNSRSDESMRGNSKVGSDMYDRKRVRGTPADDVKKKRPRRDVNKQSKPIPLVSKPAVKIKETNREGNSPTSGYLDTKINSQNKGTQKVNTNYSATSSSPKSENSEKDEKLNPADGITLDKQKLISRGSSKKSRKPDQEKLASSKRVKGSVSLENSRSGLMEGDLVGSIMEKSGIEEENMRNCRPAERRKDKRRDAKEATLLSNNTEDDAMSLDDNDLVDFEFDLDDYPVEMLIQNFDTSALKDVSSPNVEPRDVSLGSLKQAIREGDEMTVRAALAAGFDIETVDGASGMTLLMWAAAAGQDGVVELLLRRKAIVNAAQKNGRTALMHACEQGFPETADILLRCGAEINRQQIAGETALMKACKKGHTEVIEVLLKHGVDTKIQSNSGHTALQFAGRSSYFELPSLLGEHEIRLSSSVEGAIVKCVGKAVSLCTTPVLSYRCLAPQEGAKYILDFNYNPDHFTQEMDIILFCIRANFRDNEVSMTFGKDNGVRSVLLNDKAHLPLLHGIRSAYSLSPEPGQNELCLHTHISPFRLIVCIYAFKSTAS